MSLEAQFEKAEKFVTTCGPAISGWFAVLMWHNPEGFWEPWDTHPMRRPTLEEATADARAWAVNLGLEFQP
jgi:hypothetical protein